MAFVIIDCEQGTPAWARARAGRLTASAAKLMLAKSRSKGEESASRRNLRTHLALEIVTGEPQTAHFLSLDMKAGQLEEPSALREYEHHTGEMLDRVGFLSHTTLAAGASPDSVVFDAGVVVGIIEAKVRRPANHLEILRSPSVPSEFLAQCIHHLWISGAPWCDLASYCKAFPPRQRMAVRRLTRAQVDLEVYETEVLKFLSEVNRLVEEIRNG